MHEFVPSTSGLSASTPLLLKGAHGAKVKRNKIIFRSGNSRHNGWDFFNWPFTLAWHPQHGRGPNYKGRLSPTPACPPQANRARPGAHLSLSRLRVMSSGGRELGRAHSTAGQFLKFNWDPLPLLELLFSLDLERASLVAMPFTWQPHSAKFYSSSTRKPQSFHCFSYGWELPRQAQLAVPPSTPAP